jgi:ParB/Sulfiredoxin domain
MFRHHRCGPLLDLDDVRARLGLRTQVARGVRPIAVTSIVGTAGRCCDFDRCFHPLKPNLKERARALKRRFPTGDFPPIDVVQVGEAYFVVDGHHRVAAARDLGVAALDADVIELPTAYGLRPDVSVEDVALVSAERSFRENSGLAIARPTARIPAASAMSYSDLLTAVKGHGYDLCRTKGEWVASLDVAGHWFDCVYVPLLSAARLLGLTEALPLPEGDLVLSLLRAQQASFGPTVDCRALADAAASSAEEAADRR